MAKSPSSKSSSSKSMAHRPRNVFELSGDELKGVLQGQPIVLETHTHRSPALLVRAARLGRKDLFVMGLDKGLYAYGSYASSTSTSSLYQSDTSTFLACVRADVRSAVWLLEQCSSSYAQQTWLRHLMDAAIYAPADVGRLPWGDIFNRKLLDDETMGMLAGAALLAHIPNLDLKDVLRHNKGVLAFPRFDYGMGVVISRQRRQNLADIVNRLPHGLLLFAPLHQWRDVGDLKLFEAICLHLQINGTWDMTVANSKRDAPPQWKTFVQDVRHSGQGMSASDFLQAWRLMEEACLDVRKPDSKKETSLRGLAAVGFGSLPREAVSTIVQDIVSSKPDLVYLKDRAGKSLETDPPTEVRSMALSLAQSLALERGLKNVLHKSKGSKQAAPKRRM